MEAAFMNAKIDYQTTVTNTLIADIKDMANDASNYSVNPGKDFTRKRKLDFYNLIMVLIIMGNSNTDYEFVKYLNTLTLIQRNFLENQHLYNSVQS